MTSALLAAVDIGATKTLLAVGPHQASIRTLALVRMNTPRGPDAAIDRIARAIRSRARETGGELAVVSCGAPGPLDRATGTIVHSPNLGWRNVQLAERLRADLGVAVTLDDDARLGALGEAIHGAGRGFEVVAYVTLSSGIGAGIVIGGRIHHGAHDLAGEIGHLVIDPDGPACGCGHRGCVEAFAGGQALAHRAREGGGGPAAPPPTAHDVFREAAEGSPRAAQLVAEAVEAVGRGLAALAAALDPDVIVLGGAVALGQPDFTGRAVAIARERWLAAGGNNLRARTAELGERSVLAGAWEVAGGRGRPKPGRRVGTASPPG